MLYAQSGTSYSGPSFSQGKINSRWWLSFYRNTLWNVVSSLNHVAASSDDGLFWSDPLPTALPGNERTLDILPAAGSWSSAYYSTERAAYRLDSSKLRNELGWIPPFHASEGLTSTASWYRKL